MQKAVIFTPALLLHQFYFRAFKGESFRAPKSGLSIPETRGFEQRPPFFQDILMVIMHAWIIKRV